MFVGCGSLSQRPYEDILIGEGSNAGESLLCHRRGVKHYQAGKLTHAERDFEQAIRYDPANGPAHNNLGLIYFDQRKLALAATQFDSAATLLPDDPSPLNNLGQTMEAGGRGFEALDYYYQAYELDPANPVYLGNLVRTRIRMEDIDETLVPQLQELLMIECRPQWIEWTTDQLALNFNPNLDRGPAPTRFGGGENLKPNRATPEPGLHEGQPRPMPQSPQPNDSIESYMQEVELEPLSSPRTDPLPPRR